MKKKAELAVVPPTRPAQTRGTSSDDVPAPPRAGRLQNAEPTLVPVPVKRNGRSRNP